MAGELTTAVVVDDHPVIVAGVASWCAAANPPIRLVDAGGNVGVAWTGPGAQADVVVLDLHLTGEVPAYGDLRRLVDAGRQVVVYTMRDDEEVTLACLDIGAFAYLTKVEGTTHLVAAIHAAARHLPYTPPAMARAIGSDTRPDRPRLTRREIDVLVNWFSCDSKEMVGRKLGLSPSTVGSYIDRARIKYANAGRDAPTKAALVARAIQDGLVRVEDL